MDLTGSRNIKRVFHKGASRGVDALFPGHTQCSVQAKHFGGKRGPLTGGDCFIFK